MAGCESKHDPSNESLVEVIELTLNTDDERNVASDKDDGSIISDGYVIQNKYFCPSQ